MEELKLRAKEELVFSAVETVEQCTVAEEKKERISGYEIAKRVFDTFCSALALIVLSPVYLITALCIKLDSKGPVFFIQERVGKDKKVFKAYKFRSMCVDAPKLREELRQKSGQSQGEFKPKDDPRITRVGKIIRKLSIDELPQLLNIIKGEMSIVGPRPLALYEAEELSEKYDERYLALPGLTCIWQIKGRSNVISYDERMEMDLEYIRERGFFFDLVLILKTIPAVLKGEGAY